MIIRHKESSILIWIFLRKPRKFHFFQQLVWFIWLCSNVQTVMVAVPSFAALSKSAKIGLSERFFSLKSMSLRAYYLLKFFLLISILKPSYLLKSCSNFDEVAKVHMQSIRGVLHSGRMYNFVRHLE